MRIELTTIIYKESIKLVVVYTKHQQLNNTKNYLSLHTIHYLKLHERSNNNTLRYKP